MNTTVYFPMTMFSVLYFFSSAKVTGYCYFIFTAIGAMHDSVHGNFHKTITPEMFLSVLLVQKIGIHNKYI